MFETMNFQKWTIGIFTIILVIILIYLGMNINTPNTSKPWPPLTANCPDYWADVNGDGSNCIATKDNNTGEEETVKANKTNTEKITKKKENS